MFHLFHISCSHSIQSKVTLHIFLGPVYRYKGCGERFRSVNRGVDGALECGHKEALPTRDARFGTFAEWGANRADGGVRLGHQIRERMRGGCVAIQVRKGEIAARGSQLWSCSGYRA